MPEWTPERVQDLLQHPQRLLTEHPWSAWLHAQGGLAKVYNRLRTFPLPQAQQRVLNVLLDTPGQPPNWYADTLHIHFTTYYRHLRRLQHLLADFLNSAEAAPPSRALPALPAPATPLIGRAELIERATQLLQQSTRLLTLTGIGGSGKTRLAMELAAALHAAYADGAVWVPLAAVQSPELVWSAIGQALGIREGSTTTLTDAVLQRLRDLQGLLFLDTFEHLLGAAGSISRILHSAPELRIVITSRVVLRLSDEYVLPVPPLPVHAARSAPASVPSAVELFLQRAQMATPRWQSVAADLDLAAAICQRLDGLPLAIELAAARLRILSPAALLDRLDDRLALLTGGARDLPARQQTLRATLDWSFQALSAAEQTLLARLSVFVGGWNLTLAAVVAERAPDDLVLLDQLTSLLDASLISSAGPERWSMLQIVQEYARERLVASGQLAAVEQRLAVGLCALVDQAQQHAIGPEAEQWFDQLEVEHANIQACLRWAVSHAAPLALRMAANLWRFWWAHSHLSTGRLWLEQALARAPESAAPERVRALNGLGALCWSQGDYTEAAHWFERCLHLQEQLGDVVEAAMTRNNLGLVALKQAQYERAARIFRDNLEPFRLHNNQYAYAASLSNLGMVAVYRQDYAEAQTLFTESLALRKVTGNTWAIAASLVNLALVAVRTAAYSHARDLYLESLALLQDHGEKESMAECLEGLAAVLVAWRHPERAAQLAGAAEGLRTQIGAPLAVIDQPFHAATLARIREQLDAETLAVAWASGQALDLNHLQELVRSCASPDD